MKENSPKAVIVLGTQRAGTTVFGEFLGTHPDLSYHGEVLHTGLIDSWQNYWNYSAGRIASDRTNISPDRRLILFGEFLDFLRDRTNNIPIVDIKYGLLFAMERSWKARIFPELLSYLIACEFPIFHLVRENLLRQFVSLQIAERTAEWNRPTNGPHKDWPKIQVHLEPGRLLAQMESEVKRVETVRGWLEGYAGVREIFYDEMFEGGAFSPDLVTAVAGFLGSLPKFDPVPLLRRQNPEPLCMLIENHAQIVVALGGTQYEWMLNDLEVD